MRLVVPYLRRSQLTVLALAFIVVGITGSLSYVLGRDIVAAPVIQTEAAALVRETNDARADQGAPPLSWNQRLADAAQAKALHLFDKQYFDHIGPDGTTPWTFFRSAGYAYQSAGENLAIDFMNPLQAVPAWLASPSHRANMLDPEFSEIGIAIVEGTMDGRPTTVIVQLFGQPRSTLGLE